MPTTPRPRGVSSRRVAGLAHTWSSPVEEGVERFSDLILQSNERMLLA